VFAAGPTARPALTFFELLLGAADAALARLVLLRIFDPTDELVACDGRDVHPRGERWRIPDEGLAEIGGELVDDASGDALCGHGREVSSEGIMLAIHVPCLGCGAPVPVRLGQMRIDCTHCGSHRKLPADVDARLRAHHHRVEAALELAELRQKRLGEGQQIMLGCPIVLVLLGTLGAGLYNALKGELVAAGAVLGVGVVVFTILVIKMYGARKPAERKRVGAHEVKCSSCGAGVPLCAGDVLLECPFCQVELHLSDAAFDESVVLAEEELAKVNRRWREVFGTDEGALGPFGHMD